MALQDQRLHSQYKNFTSSNLLYTGPGDLQGVVINSHTNGTLKFWDNTSAATTVIFNTITLAVGERYIPLYGANFTTGCFITIGGTIDATIMYNPRHG